MHTDKNNLIQFVEFSVQSRYVHLYTCRSEKQQFSPKILEQLMDSSYLF